MSKTRILLVDDHTILREGLRAFLRYHDDMEVVGEARNGVEAIALVEQLRPDVILMDIAMPEMNGIEATQRICEQYPATQVLILTQHEDPQYILQLLQAGAAGYVLKDVVGTDLLTAVRTVARGESYLPAAVAKMLAQEIRQTGTSKIVSDESLTPRELQVLEHIARGQTNAQIAAALSISENTVAWHRANLRDKLGIHSVAEFVRYAIRHGLVNENG